MYKYILVPLDRSTLAERALPPALGIARYSEGVLQLLRVALGQTTSPARVAPNSILSKSYSKIVKRLKAIWKESDLSVRPRAQRRVRRCLPGQFPNPSWTSLKTTTST